MRRPILIFVLMSVVAFAGVSAQAICVKCAADNTCWASTYANAAKCYSYGSSCLTSGQCFDDGSGGCTDPTCPPEQQNAYQEPLAANYVLTAVSVERPPIATTTLAVVNIASSVEY